MRTLLGLNRANVSCQDPSTTNASSDCSAIQTSQDDEGSASLKDFFSGRSQLLVYHFMFGPEYTPGCPSCSVIADAFDGSVVHLVAPDRERAGLVGRHPDERQRETLDRNRERDEEMPKMVFVALQIFQHSFAGPL